MDGQAVNLIEHGLKGFIRVSTDFDFTDHLQWDEEIEGDRISAKTFYVLET